MASVTISRVPCPPASVPTSSLIKIMTRRPLGGSLSRYWEARKIPSLIFVAPPAWKELICSASFALSFVKGTRNSASVEKVKSATSSSGFSAARAVVAASRKGPRNGPIESLKSNTSATLMGNASRLKTSSFCSTPSSRTSKLSFFRSAMIWPALVLTVASSRTRFTPTRMTPSPWSCAWALLCIKNGKQPSRADKRSRFREYLDFAIALTSDRWRLRSSVSFGYSYCIGASCRRGAWPAGKSLRNGFLGALKELRGLGGAAIGDATSVKLVFGDLHNPGDFRRNKNGVASRRIGNCDFDIGPLKILLTAPETDAALGHVFAGNDVVREARPPDASFVVDLGTRVFAAVVHWRSRRGIGFLRGVERRSSLRGRSQLRARSICGLRGRGDCCIAAGGYQDMRLLMRFRGAFPKS